MRSFIIMSTFLILPFAFGCHLDKKQYLDSASVPKKDSPLSSIYPEPTPLPQFSISAPAGLRTTVGQSIKLGYDVIKETIPDKFTAKWSIPPHSEDKAIIDSDGLLRTLKPGGIQVELRIKNGISKALIACSVLPSVSERITLPAEVSSQPQINQQSGLSRIISDQIAWEKFWKETAQTYYRGEPVTPLPPPPIIDFMNYSVVVILERKNANEEPPVLTNIDQNGDVNIVYPKKIAFPYNINTEENPEINLFKIKKHSLKLNIKIKHLQE